MPRPGRGHMLPVVSVTTRPASVDPSKLPQVSSRWSWRDHLGRLKVRWGIGRKSYSVEPGLYVLGKPGSASPVLVSASYKLSFDILRRDMAGRDAWILVLDTKGINVWCAAGKGTFGTSELVDRAESSGLSAVVSHRTLIVPQLGAPGVAAHEVKKASGFKVLFGPVRSADLPRFLDSGSRADDAMRRVTFNFIDRIVLVPMELLPALKWSLPVLAVLWLAGGWGWWGYSGEAFLGNGVNVTAAFLGAVAAGAVAAPLLLPWMPGRSFSLKGAVAGFIWALLFLPLSAKFLPASLPSRSWEASVWLLALPALSSFLTFNFTGSSAITSLSGVRKEFRIAVPLQAAGAAAGLFLWAAGHFHRGAF